LALEGEINTQVQIGGIPVNPGDLIVADVKRHPDPAGGACSRLIEASEARERREVWVREELHKRRKLSDISNAAEKVKHRWTGISLRLKFSARFHQQRRHGVG
jgi:regulator of RNase E activity RraA